jgi:hypothetical protein
VRQGAGPEPLAWHRPRQALVRVWVQGQRVHATRPLSPSLVRGLWERQAPRGRRPTTAVMQITEGTRMAVEPGAAVVVVVVEGG